jgi:glyoxylase-like metal-dependent hydrolase (beta-lactamase superfamily II)
MEVAPGVHNVVTDLQHATGVTNTFLLIGSQAAAFIDTGWDRPGEAQARIDYWRRLGAPPLAALVVTHRHAPHWQNAPAIQRACGNPPIIASHVEQPVIDARMQGARVDRAVRDGDTLSLGDCTLQFVEAPGHTYGSLAVYVPEIHALFTGDTVMGTGTSVVNPEEGDLTLYLQTLQKFMRLDPAVIYPGQGPVVTDPRSRLEALVAHRHERERQILALLAKTPCTADQIAAALYADVKEGVRHLARNQVVSHLLKLEKEGRAVADGEVYWLAAHGSVNVP